MEYLHDESQRIQAFVKNQLIKAWLACYNDNYLVFLRALMFDSNEEDLKTSAATCLTVTNCLFRIQPWEEIMGVLTLNDQLTIPLDVLSWEAAIYLRLLVEFCRKSDELDTAVEALLPDLVVFGSYIRRFCDMAGNFDQFEVILGEFFIITSTYDLGDSATRETLNGLVKYILRKFDLREEIVETIIRNLEKSMTKVEIRENAILEIIADIKYPTEDDELHSITTKISELKVRARQVKHNQDVAVKEMNYDLAGDCKSELDQIIITIEELQIDFTNSQPLVPITDTITLCRWLKILRGYLVSPTVVYLTPGLKIICDEVVDLLRNTDSNQVRTKALECYALCCIVDEETARAGMYVFYPTMVVTNDVGGDMDTLLMSLKATVDLLSVYGSCIIPSSENNEDVPSIFSFKDVIQSLVNLMDHEDVTVQEWSGVGLCKLIENGRIFSPTVLSRMVLKWCNPSTQDSEGQRLRQAIGMSLEKVPQLANSGEQLESAFFITVETLLNAPKTSPLSEVNVFDIIQFLLQLFSMCDESLYMHKSLALKLCLKLKETPEENTILMYSKTLLLLELLPYDKFHYDKLQALCDEIRALIINPAVLRNVEKFHVQLMDAANENSNA